MTGLIINATTLQKGTYLCRAGFLKIFWILIRIGSISSISMRKRSFMIYCMFRFYKTSLIVWRFSSHSWFFHSFQDVTKTGKRLPILTFARHLWPFNISLSCHTYCDSAVIWLKYCRYGVNKKNQSYCDTEHPIIMVIFEDSWHSYLMPRIWQWSRHFLFQRLLSVVAWIRTLNRPLAERML